jgi:hypothetical protein
MTQAITPIKAATITVQVGTAIVAAAGAPAVVIAVGIAAATVIFVKKKVG